jgi:hypothetical protein
MYNTVPYSTNKHIVLHMSSTILGNVWLD